MAVTDRDVEYTIRAVNENKRLRILLRYAWTTLANWRDDPVWQAADEEALVIIGKELGLTMPGMGK